eukprot:TRINITY_DN4104_c3_g1_i1.p1 TRINITY_DN4104_c3_g1~~TRINITY_DN4104_c3_g1_i1.p1  ORF type:complete len:400 (+),score=81.49 TRINITY_DN4104_c3_g1_i1:92-1291(+)
MLEEEEELEIVWTPKQNTLTLSPDECDIEETAHDCEKSSTASLSPVARWWMKDNNEQEEIKSCEVSIKPIGYKGERKKCDFSDWRALAFLITPFSKVSTAPAPCQTAFLKHINLRWLAPATSFINTRQKPRPFRITKPSTLNTLKSFSPLTLPTFKEESTAVRGRWVPESALNPPQLLNSPRSVLVLLKKGIDLTELCGTMVYVEENHKKVMRKHKNRWAAYMVTKRCPVGRVEAQQKTLLDECVAEYEAMCRETDLNSVVEAFEAYWNTLLGAGRDVVAGRKADRSVDVLQRALVKTREDRNGKLRALESRRGSSLLSSGRRSNLVSCRMHQHIRHQHLVNGSAFTQTRHLARSLHVLETSKKTDAQKLEKRNTIVAGNNRQAHRIEKIRHELSTVYA